MRCAGSKGNLILAVAAVAVASMPLWATPYYLQLASTALIAAMFALSLQLLVGGVGLVSLAHGAFYGLGAYSVYLLGRVLPETPSILLSLPAAGFLAGLVAAMIAPLVLRTRGFFFLMVTLAFGQMLFYLFHDTALGGGTDGVFIQRPDLGWTVTRAERPTVFLLLNLGTLAMMYATLWWFMQTLLGQALAGIRANEPRMRTMGHDVRRMQFVVFVMAGAMAGVAGHMAAMTDAFVTPDLLGWHRSVEALLAVLLGGIGWLHGPILGAIAFTAIGEFGQHLTERQRLVEGGVILLAVLAMRYGLAGLRRSAR